MTFLALERLWLLLAVAALAAAYVGLQGRRRRYAVRFTNLDLLASVAPHRPGWRRHVPAAAMALALGVLVVGFARPAREVRVPREEATVLLVVDVSLSMQATDVRPTRLEAAVAAARAFVDDLPDRFRVGLVAFDRTARVVVAPTDEHAAVDRGLASLTPGPGTAAGDAIVAGLEALAAATSEPGDAEARRPLARMVLLSDGMTTTGRPVAEAADEAAAQEVPISTIAYGTAAGMVQVDGRDIPVPADPEAMRLVAERTDGSFFEATSGEELRRVYDDIGSRIGYVVQRREVTATLVGAAFVLLLAALTAALAWTGRIV